MVKASTRKRVAAKTEAEQSDNSKKSQIDSATNGASARKKQRVEEVSNGTADIQHTPAKQLDLNQNPDRLLFA